MTSEMAEAARPAIVIASGAASTWWTMENAAAWVSISVGVLTIIYIIFQIAHLLRTWYIREKLYARKRNPSDFMKLDSK